MNFTKGHGSKNDFICFADPDGQIELTAEQVRFLCDRRAGIGADGILRAVRLKHIPPAQLPAELFAQDPDTWFMDYRNADGTMAEMCGNGLRVFTRFLIDSGLTEGPTVNVATRAGMRSGRILADGSVEASLGKVTLGTPDSVTIVAGGRRFSGTPADVGNPHAVCFTTGIAQINITKQPSWLPPKAFPNGVNVEFVEDLGPGKLNLRVHERGSGETLACGTGVVAAAAVAATRWPEPVQIVEVNVPGGTLYVRFFAGNAYLIGPAVLTFSGAL
ncbi:MAG: diaminopimelate epimerase [Propionibacteriaceae bacterium]|jgi:diaminopimelate epimerase|nr:diaminopimelate epimerase [Propionibacteriaceae bacterium]